VRVRKLVAGVCDTHTKLEKVKLELNLKIIELQLKAQPSTPPEIKEQHESTVRYTITAVDSTIKDCTIVFEQSLEVVTSLQEDPTM